MAGLSRRHRCGSGTFRSIARPTRARPSSTPRTGGSVSLGTRTLVVSPVQPQQGTGHPAKGQRKHPPLPGLLRSGKVPCTGRLPVE